jgi:hypothetical protein
MKKALTSLPARYQPSLSSCLVLLLVAGSALAAPQPRAWQRLAAKPVVDTLLTSPLPADAATQPPLRRPAAERLQKLRGQHDFQYVDVTDAPTKPGLWDRLTSWLWRWLSSVLDTSGGHFAWNALWYTLMGATLVFAVLKLLQVDLTKVFGRAARTLPLAYEAGQENIHELNFTDALAQAETAGNLRLAVRLGYLELLKQLTDRDFIAWQPDKTNQTYLHELAASRPTARPAFAELTRQFEYAWYGELPVSAALYRQVRADQRQFGQQLSGAGRAAHVA